MKIVRSDGETVSEDVSRTAINIFELFSCKLEMMGKEQQEQCTDDIPGQSIDDYFNEICGEHLESIECSRTRCQVEALLHRLKVYYLDYAGESFANVSAGLFFNEETGDDVILPLDIIEALASDVPPSKILLNTIVDKIEWGNEGVTLRCGTLAQFCVDYVICTLPVSI